MTATFSNFQKTQKKCQLAVAVQAVLFGAVFLPTSSMAEVIDLDSTSDEGAVITTEVGADIASFTENPLEYSDFDKNTLSDSVEVSSEELSDTQLSHTQSIDAPSNDNAAILDVKQIADSASEPIALERQTSSQNDNKERSLEKLSQYYEAKENTDARCQGVWTMPAKQTTGSEHASVVQDGFYAQADHGYYDNKDYAELTGNVMIERNGQQVYADKITYQPSTGQVNAEGEVLFSDNPSDGSKSNSGLIGVADKLGYSNDGQTAFAKDVAFASTTLNAHGHAETLQKVGSNRYDMENVMFSTCPPNQRKWHLDAKNIEINNETGRGIAKHSTLKIGDTPVFYLPYFNFPIDNRRSSGFLLPTVGISSNRLEISTPYYLNLAPNFDATLTPTVFSDTNPMLTGEFRYLTKHLGSGVLTGSYLPSDRNYGKEDRKRLFYDHAWHSSKIPHLSAYANYRYVSDRDYLSDFDTLGLENNPLNLPRRIGASYYNDNIIADFKVETFQTLKATYYNGTAIMDKDKPYSRLPQLSVSYHFPRFDNKLQINGVHQSAYFKKSITDNSETEKSGFRMYNQVSASYPLYKPWGYVTPKIALNHLYASYDEDSLAMLNLNKAEGTYSVFAPQVGLEAGLYFEKAGSPFGLYDDSLGGHQVIMPRLKYTYTPYKNQANIPNFETAISQVGYDRLLSDTWFLGYDRIADLHAITPAIEYKYIDNKGITRFEGGIAEQVYLDDVKVGIDDSASYTGSTSGMAWRANTQPKNNFWIDTSGSLTQKYELDSVVAQLRYQPNEQSLYNIGFVRRNENPSTGQLALSAVTASAVFPVNSRWRILSQAQYDYQNSRLLDALVGVNYEDCCYGLSIYARRYRNDLSVNSGMENAVMAEIRLNGITNGGKLNRLMSERVIGFDHTNNAWQRAY